MRHYELYLYPAGRGGYTARYYDSRLSGWACICHWRASCKIIVLYVNYRIRKVASAFIVYRLLTSLIRSARTVTRTSSYINPNISIILL